MREHKTAAVTAGVLYITGTVAGVACKFLVQGPVHDAPDPLAYAAGHPDRVVTGALLVLVMGLSLLFVPVVLFPILRRVDEVLAVGYLALRGAVEAGAYLISAIALLMLVPVSDAMSVAAGTGTPTGRRLGILLVDFDALQGVLALVFCLGGVMFYALLYRSRIVPRWLSVWGLIGISPYVAGYLLVMYGVIGSSSTALTALLMPLAVQEMVLGVWMIARGFRPATAIRPQQAAAGAAPRGAQPERAGLSATTRF